MLVLFSASSHAWIVVVHATIKGLKFSRRHKFCPLGYHSRTIYVHGQKCPYPFTIARMTFTDRNRYGSVNDRWQDTVVYNCALSPFTIVPCTLRSRHVNGSVHNGPPRCSIYVVDRAPWTHRGLQLSARCRPQSPATAVSQNQCWTVLNKKPSAERRATWTLVAQVRKSRYGAGVCVLARVCLCVCVCVCVCVCG